MLSVRSSRRGGDRGSVALVVLVIFVMAGLAAVMVSRNAVDLRLAVTEEHQAAADAAIDLGIARATGRVQSGETDKEFVEAGTAGDAAWTVTVRRVDDARWDVDAEATSDRSTRRVSAAIVKRPGSQWAVSQWRRTPLADAKRGAPIRSPRDDAIGIGASREADLDF